jgi:DNA-directed RNA polymerase subunit RPC12/RpoP
VAVISIAMQERMCHSKRVYLDEVAAGRAITRRAGRVRHALRYYRCPNCSFWHLTKKPIPGVRMHALVSIPGVPRRRRKARRP